MVKEDYEYDLKLARCKDLSKEWIRINYLSSNIAFGSMLIDFITCGVYSSASHTSFNSVLSILFNPTSDCILWGLFTTSNWTEKSNLTINHQSESML